MSTQIELNSINAAISAITGGAQEYQIGSRRVRKADLAALLKERDRLEWKLAESDGSNTAVAYFDRR